MSPRHGRPASPLALVGSAVLQAGLGCAAAGSGVAPGASARQGGPPIAEPAKSVELFATGGGGLDLEAALPVGRVTVLDFWSASCGACTVVGGMLAVQVALEPGVVIRKVDVGDGFSAVARAYAITALPHYRIYDRRRRLRYDLVGNDCLDAPRLARLLAAEPTTAP